MLDRSEQLQLQHLHVCFTGFGVLMNNGILPLERSRYVRELVADVEFLSSNVVYHAMTTHIDGMEMNFGVFPFRMTWKFSFHALTFAPA